MALSTLTINITGMHCNSCIQQIESALREVDGLKSIQVALGEAVVTLDDSRTSKREIITAICQDGRFTVVGFTS